MVEPGTTERNRLSGKYVIAGIIAMALTAALFAFYVRLSAQRQAMTFWGPQDALLIRDADEIELLELTDATESEEQLGEEGGGLIGIAGAPRLRIVSRRSIIGAPGVLNARHALLRDSSFVWDKTPSEEPNTTPNWRYALRFADAEREIIITLDLDRRRLGAFDPPREAAIDPIAQALRNVITRVLEKEDQATPNK